MRLFSSVKGLSLFGAATLSLSVAAQSTFSLFAYGTSGGLSAAPLFYDNGHVMLLNLSSPSNLTTIYFTRDDNGPSTWTAHSNTTVDPNPPFTNGSVTLETSGGSSQVKVGNSSSDALALLLFGQTVFAKVDNKVQNPFYAAATETEGIYQLVWGPQDAEDAQLEAIVLRTMEPPRRGN